MKLKARKSLKYVCFEPMSRLQVWIDEISIGSDTVKNIYRETYFRGLNMEHAEVTIWAKLALDFATQCVNGDMMPPFLLSSFSNAVEESLRNCQYEDGGGAWVNLPSIF